MQIHFDVIYKKQATTTVKYHCVACFIISLFVKNGVPTITNYKFNAANQLTEAGSISYEYEKGCERKNSWEYQK